MDGEGRGGGGQEGGGEGWRVIFVCKPESSEANTVLNMKDLQAL